MNRLWTGLGSLLVGLVVFVGVGVAVTELLAPHVWLSVILAAPAAVVTGLGAVALSYLGLTARDERASAGAASPVTMRRFRATAAALAAFVLVSTAFTLALLSLGTGVATAMLFGGFPAGVVSAAIAAAVAARRTPDRQSPPGPSVG